MQEHHFLKQFNMKYLYSFFQLFVLLCCFFQQRRKTILTPPKPANQENIADKEKEKQNNIVDEAARACLELLRAEGIENMETEEPVKNDSFFGRVSHQLLFLFLWAILYL